MAYRMDWLVTLRAVGHDGVAKLVGQIRDTLGEEVTVQGEWPSRLFHSCRNCRFSLPAWELPFPEAVVKSMQLAQRLGSIWQFSLPEEGKEAVFTGLFRDINNADRLYGVARAAFSLVSAQVPIPAERQVPDISVPDCPDYTVTIHAEAWPADPAALPVSESLVAVEFSAHDVWSAHCYTLQAIENAMRYQPGPYYWEPGMIIVKAITRPIIEAAIADLIRQQTFQYAFHWIGEDDEVANEDEYQL